MTGLSILSRGSMDEKLRWTFSLYDINGDGCITREEMTDIVTAVYELMGKFADPNLSHNNENIRQKVDRMFQVSAVRAREKRSGASRKLAGTRT